MIVEDEFIKINDSLYPCVSLYGCILGSGDNTYIFHDKIKEYHSLVIKNESFFTFHSHIEPFLIEWETRDGILNIKGKFTKPIKVNLALVDERKRKVDNMLNFYELVDMIEKPVYYVDKETGKGQWDIVSWVTKEANGGSVGFNGDDYRDLNEIEVYRSEDEYNASTKKEEKDVNRKELFHECEKNILEQLDRMKILVYNNEN